MGGQDVGWIWGGVFFNNGHAGRVVGPVMGGGRGGSGGGNGGGGGRLKSKND